jgi:cyclic pyranopterin phosphate synthase
MKDARGRTIDYLRISLTDLCNFRCIYCMPPKGVRKIRHSDMLRFEEIVDIVRLLTVRFGVTKVRITGGEPLVRRGVVGLLGDLSRIKGLRDLTLTTNGYLLEEMGDGIWQAGIRRLNVSLDTLKRDRFRTVTGVDGLEQVLRGIEKVREIGFSPIKINVVAMQENLDEATEFVEFGVNNGIEVRFIERMKFVEGPGGHFISNQHVKTRIEEYHRLIPIEEAGDRKSPAVRYWIDGTRATCGFISPVSEPFCDRCNRMRLGGDGRLLPCLQGSTKYDLMPWIRPLFLSDGLAARIEEIIERDPKENGLRDKRFPMSQIGG